MCALCSAKTHHVLYFLKALRGASTGTSTWASSGAGMSGASSGACLEHHLGYVLGMSGVSSGECLWHHLGYVWGIIWGMSRASSGAWLGHYLGLFSPINNNPWCYMHLWCCFLVIEAKIGLGEVRGVIFIWINDYLEFVICCILISISSTLLVRL